MDPGGKPIDFVGVQPDVPVKAGTSEFAGNRDPVLQAALGKLRERE